MTFHECKMKFGRPLIERKSDEIHKALYLDRESESVVITYADTQGFYFTIYPPKHLAIDAYRDPTHYALSELNGICNPRRLNPAQLNAAA